MAEAATSECSPRISEAEWRTRVELAALYRILDMYGMSDLANQEVGARVEGEPGHYLLHPYGMFYEEIRASDLVKIDAEGNVVDQPGVWVSDGGTNLCRWIFGNRPDVDVFIHGHCEDVMAVGSIETGLLPVTQPAVYLMHRLTYIDYEFHEDAEFAEHFVRTLGRNDLMISHNHGYYTLGGSAREAFFRAYYLRQACAVQLKAMQTGDALRVIDAQQVARFQDQMEASPHYNYDGRTEWAALLRKVERDCPDYRT